MAGPVEAILSDGMLLIQLIRQGIHVGAGGHGLMIRRVKDCYLPSASQANCCNRPAQIITQCIAQHSNVLHSTASVAKQDLRFRTHIARLPQVSNPPR